MVKKRIIFQNREFARERVWGTEGESKGNERIILQERNEWTSDKEDCFDLIGTGVAKTLRMKREP